MDPLSEKRLWELGQKYSLGNLEQSELFRTHQNESQPYSRQLKNLYEALWFEDNCKIVEKFQNGTGEKLGFDENSQTWFYESWKEGLVVKSWKRAEWEWGELEETDSKGSTQEKWTFTTEEYSYEHFRKEPNNLYGSKAGKKGEKEWREIWWQKPNEKQLEKFWVEGNNKWGLKEGNSDGRDWGEEWHQNCQKSEQKKWNKKEEDSWGTVEGKDGNLLWHETWTTSPVKSFSDKWWEDGLKQWGIKSLTEGKWKYTEEWERIGSAFKVTKSYDDGFGHKNVVTEGEGETYKYTDTFNENLETGEKHTQKEGFSENGTWKLVHKQKHSSHFVHNKGTDHQGKWEETWVEESGVKWAKKTGESQEGGKWEEFWKEEDGCKQCTKSGTKGEDLWWEEWKEDSSSKYCRKEQHKPDGVHLQEWREYYLPEGMQTVGKFYHNGDVIKEWDDLVPN